MVQLFYISNNIRTSPITQLLEMLNNRFEGGFMFVLTIVAKSDHLIVNKIIRFI